MKKLILYTVIIAALFFIPVEKQDVGALEPVQAVWLSLQDGMVALETDTEDFGKGNTVAEALENMKRQSHGIIYLDTAQFLMVSDDAVEYIPDLEPYLKSSVRACLRTGQGTVKDATRYMQAHKTGISLRRWNHQEKLPNLPV